MLLDRSEGVPEVELRDLVAEDDAGDAGEAVVQARPEAGVNDLVAEVVRPVEVPYRVQVPRRPGRIEPVDIEIDLVRTKERPEKPRPLPT